MVEQKPRRTVYRDDERLAPLGGVRVILDVLPHESRVFLDRKVWGLANTDKVFLGPSSAKAEAYAESVFGDLLNRADARTDYRAKRKLRNAIGRDLARLVHREGR